MGLRLSLIKEKFRSWFIPEPSLIFGKGGRHVDPKAGLATFGPCILEDQRSPPPTAIRIGIIGTGDSISGTQSLIQEYQSPIPAIGNVDPNLFPSYPGFEEVFGCALSSSDEWIEVVSDKEFGRIADRPNRPSRILESARILEEKLANLAILVPRPSVVIIALPQKMLRLLESAPEQIFTPPVGDSLQLTLFPEDEELPYPEIVDLSAKPLNLRGLIKAHAMQLSMPTQILRPDTLAGSSRVQDRATVAWNLSVAIYYKAGGYPWRLADPLPGACYLGISFYRDRTHLQSNTGTSVVQIFTRTGEGLVLRGKRFEWKGRSPHLSEEGAFELMTDALRLYDSSLGHSPSRLVVHKTSRYWPDELEGFKTASQEVGLTDFLSLERRGIRFTRDGKYAPIRGSVMEIQENDYVVYTRGYVPYLKTYPGLRVPNPVEVLEHHGDSSPQTVTKEILSLTKLNWNSADFSCADPVTLKFAREVGSVLAYIPEHDTPKSEHLYYM